MENFINDIITGLEAVNDGILIGNKKWTIAIKKAIIDVAEKHKLKVNCNLNGEDYKKNENKEWLYDIIVYSYNKNIFDEVYLVGESEWNYDLAEIEYDFLKLIFTRSKIRLLVYQVSEENYNDYYNRLIEIVEKSKSCIKGDVYLFGVFNISTDEFKVEKYIKQ